MRKFTALLITVAPLSSALAHTLGGETTLLDELSHQLGGLHHLPMLAILLGAGFLAWRWLARSRPG